MDTVTLVILEILAILALVLANGFFAASEFALVAARKSRIKHWVRKGDKKALGVQKLILQPDRFLAAIQIGITFIGTLAGVFGGATLVQGLIPVIAAVPIPMLQHAAEPIAIAIVVVFITLLSVVLGELIPKYLALGNPEGYALHVAGPIMLFSKLTFFPVTVLTFLARLILRLFGFSKLPERGQVTEDEINILISEGIDKGIFDPTEQRLIKSIFDFTDIAVHQSMTPRVNIVGIKLDWDAAAIFETVNRTGFSRYPVYKESLDDIVGILYTKDLILKARGTGPLNLQEIVRKPLFVPDSMRLTVLLKKLQTHRVHIAVVLDEFGGTAGLITLEDILEEIVGEIHDEHDYAQSSFVAHSDTVAFAAGTLRPDELNERFGTDLPEEGYDTLAGLIIDHLGRVPEPAEETTLGKLRFKVLEVDGSRIKRLRIEKKRPEPSSGGDLSG